MNSFIGISRAHTTNLAVVAPGIAEALLATAIDLVAAIPAVIIYNSFARSVTGYRAILADVSSEVLQHVSRDLEDGTPQCDQIASARPGGLQITSALACARWSEHPWQSRSRNHDGDLPELSDINVTPFIDVMLVLLIIFMVRRRSRPSMFPSTCQSPTQKRNRGRTSRSSSRSKAIWR